MDFSVVCASILLPWICWFLVMIVFRRTKDNIPPGKMGLPFIGHTLEFYAPYEMNKLHPFMAKRLTRYGQTFKSRMFGSPTIVSSNVDVVKHVLQKEWSSFHISYPSFVKQLVGNLVTTTDESKWKIHRQAFVTIIQSSLKQNILEDVQKIILDSIKTWKTNETVFLVKETKLITASVATEGLLKCKVERTVLQKMTAQLMYISHALGCIPIYFPGTTYYKAIQVRKEFLRELSKQELNQTELPNLLRSKGIVLEPESLLDLISGGIFAAFETTGTAMALAVKFIKDTPTVLEALKIEHFAIKATKEKGELLTWDDYKKMTFTQNVLTETLRCATHGFALYRKALNDVHFGDFVIPKGWGFIASVVAIHLNPDIYENPQSFNPWRWQTTSTKNFFAFGGGQRLCPGMDFARLEVCMFLHYFVTTLSHWEDEQPSKIVFNGSVKIPSGLPITIFKKTDSL